MNHIWLYFVCVGFLTTFGCNNNNTLSLNSEKIKLHNGQTLEVVESKSTDLMGPTLAAMHTILYDRNDNMIVDRDGNMVFETVAGAGAGLIPGVAQAAVYGGSFAGAYHLRRPDQTNIHSSGGGTTNVTATGTGGTGSGSASSTAQSDDGGT